MTTARTARVEHFAAFEHEGVVTDRRAVLACGCTIFVGYLTGSDLPATLLRPCCQPHQRIVDRALALLTERDPVDEELVVESAALALADASAELRPPPLAEDR